MQRSLQLDDIILSQRLDSTADQCSRSCGFVPALRGKVLEHHADGCEISLGSACPPPLTPHHHNAGRYPISEILLRTA